MSCDPIDGCGSRCLGCGATWCRAEVVSPGEPDLCRDCFETEDPKDAA